MPAGEALHSLLLGLLEQAQDGLLPLRLQEGGDVSRMDLEGEQVSTLGDDRGSPHLIALCQQVGALNGSYLARYGRQVHSPASEENTGLGILTLARP